MNALVEYSKKTYFECAGIYVTNIFVFPVGATGNAVLYNA